VDWRFLLDGGLGRGGFHRGRKIASASNERTAGPLLFFSIILNFRLPWHIQYFKFLPGFNGSSRRSAGLKQIPVQPVAHSFAPGISFYTFQEVAYIVDVYHRKVEAAESFVD